MKLMLVVGTRPQIIKSAPIIHELTKHREIDFQLIHTGQHYDYEMSKIFFEELELPDPLVNLGVGSGSHVYETAEIMIRLEKVILDVKPNLVIVPGDTNSALAAALTAAKLGIPVSHIEAGARSYDMSMAEEINRRLIDHCSTLLFAVSINCKRNLEKENVSGHIYVTGDTMYDSFLQHLRIAEKSNILDKIGVSESEYGILTLHRAENVDNERKLTEIMTTVSNLNIKVLFPVHPRTKARLTTNFDDSNIILTDPVSYHDMLKLLMHTKIVLTDSGGLQKEAFWSKVPCITLREETEWIETVKAGVNILAGSNPEIITNATNFFLTHSEEVKQRWKKVKNPYGNGEASKIILEYITQFYGA